MTRREGPRCVYIIMADRRTVLIMLMFIDAAEVHVAEVLQYGNGEGRRAFAVVGWRSLLKGG